MRYTRKPTPKPPVWRDEDGKLIEPAYAEQIAKTMRERQAAQPKQEQQEESDE